MIRGGSCDALGDGEARHQQVGEQWEVPRWTRAGMGSHDRSHIFPVVAASLGHMLRSVV